MSATSSDRESSRRNGPGKKRKRAELPLGDALPLVTPELPAFSLIAKGQDNPSPVSNGDGTNDNDEKNSQEWQTIENGRPTKKAKKIPKKDSGNYPEILFSKDARLQSQVKLSELQNLVLYILADGTSPSFVSVRHRAEIRKIVVLMVPGLERHMFEALGSSPRKSNVDTSSPDYFYPEKLKEENLPESLKPFANMFE